MCHVCYAKVRVMSFESQSEQERFSTDVCSRLWSYSNKFVFMGPIAGMFKSRWQCELQIISFNQAEGIPRMLASQMRSCLVQGGAVHQNMGTADGSQRLSPLASPFLRFSLRQTRQTCCGINEDPNGSLNGTRAWTDCADERIGSDCKETLTAFAPCGKFDDRHP